VALDACVYALQILCYLDLQSQCWSVIFTYYPSDLPTNILQGGTTGGANS
jgi:hypothetical protein